MVKQYPARRLKDALADASLVGQVVHLVGRAAPASAVMETPFGQEKALAIKVVGYGAPHGNGRGPQRLFSGMCAIPFRLLDGDQEVLVDFANAAVPGVFNLGKTHIAMNILRDDDKKCLVSGGTKPGQFASVQDRPHALQFWRDFNGGKDPPDRMTARNAGMAAFGNRPRLAHEFALRPADTVAVIGVLQSGDSGFTVVPGADGQALVTNSQAQVKEAVTMSDLAGNVDDLPVQQMQPRA